MQDIRDFYHRVDPAYELFSAGTPDTDSVQWQASS